MVLNRKVKDATLTTITWRGTRLAVPSSHTSGSFEIWAISRLPFNQAIAQKI
jgi:hypothetical protein